MSGPEEVTQYLQRTNFKTLMEWLTASCILNRPDDPAQFCFELLQTKIEERGGIPYSPEQPADYVRLAYEEASAAVDEHGRLNHDRIGGAVVSGAKKKGKQEQESKTEVPQQSSTEKLKHLTRLLEAAHALAEQLDPIEAMDTLVEESKAILKAEKAFIFVADADQSLLHTANAPRLDVAFGQGVCGQAAELKTIINVKNAQTDERYDVRRDKEKGYTTRHILCGPILDSQGTVQGVLQADNKIGLNGFTPADEQNLTSLLTLGGIAIKNSRIYKDAERAENRLQALLDIIKSIQMTDMGVNHLLFSLTTGIPKIVDAEKCSVFVVDHKNHEVWSMQGDINIRIPLERGIVGAAASSGEIVNIPDAYKDPRFNRQVDIDQGFHTRNMLCVPIKDSNGVITAVIQLINKKDSAFTPEDEIILGLFLKVAGPVLNNSQLFENVSSGGIVQDIDETAEETKVPGKSPSPRRTSRHRVALSKAGGNHNDRIFETAEEDEDG